MNYWLINHSWDSFRITKEYCGFVSPADQEKVSVGDSIVYFGNSIIFGVFEVVTLVENEFNGWGRKYSFQIKIKPLEIKNNPPKSGILAKSLESKLKMAKSEGKSPNILELNEVEFNKIKQAIEENKKQVTFE